MQTWFLLYSGNGKDKKGHLIALLEQQGIEVYQPMMTIYKVRQDRPGQFRKKSVPLFANYLFVRFDHSQLNFSHILRLSGASYFVRSCNCFATMPSEFIEQLKLHLSEKISRQGASHNDTKQLIKLIKDEPKDAERVKLLHQSLVFQTR
tara:strand:- start:7448 stop:7894 length:447 start_codon:yes stop_codon:yes gene_type:complete